MLIILTCTCGNAENMARSILKEANINDWLGIPITKGKQKSLDVLNGMSRKARLQREWQELYAIVTTRGRFVLFIGINGDLIRFADAANGDIKSKLDAQIIAKNFQ